MKQNWKSAKGLETNRYDVTFNWVKSQRTVEEQKKNDQSAYRLSMFLPKKRDVTSLIFVCVYAAFHFDKDKILHTTLIGFPVLGCSYYNTIVEK